MKKIPTANEVMAKHLNGVNPKTSAILDGMIEFAKLHLELALEEVNKVVIENDDLQGDCKSGRYHMKDCYSLENIK